MKYILAVKIIETQQVDLWEFDNEWDREDAAYEMDKKFHGLEIAYTQDDWVVDGEQMLYCGRCNSEVV